MKTIIGVAFTFLSVQAFAWGPTGHRVVGEVAQRFMEGDPMIKALQLLDGQYFARVSTWPDEIRSEPAKYSYTFNWHFTEWPDEMTTYTPGPEGGSLLQSIRDQVKVLKDEAAPKESRAFALKFIIHLVGDLHQPLHVGNGRDMGGNACKVIFQGKQTNLHHVWDEDMIGFTNLSYTELAKFITQGVSPDVVSSWKSGDLEDWALESKTIRQTIYPGDGKSYCGNPAPTDLPKLSFDYSYKFMPVVERRLYQAGVRLAKILNEALK